jgi:superfamily II DNA or RNA helicase
LVARLAKEGITVEVDDQRPEPLPQDTRLAELHNSVEFRPHQQTAINQALALERGVVHHPTAAGKTEVMVEVARRVGRPGLVLVHRKDLMWQTAQRFWEAFDDPNQEIVGVIGDGRWAPRTITVATFQTLYMRLKEGMTDVQDWLRQEIGQVHVDEAHHLPAKSFEKVMAQLWSARWRFGYSATPYKEGDPETFFHVASWLGPTVHRVGADELAEKGHLVPVDVFMIRQPLNPVSWKKWQEAVEHGIVSNTIRNNHIIDLARHLDETRSGPVVILVERLAHGEALARALGAPFIAGNAPTPTRQRTWEDMRQGRLNLLVASKVADEGLNIPPLAYLILAGGGKAPHLTVQRVGRGMRVAGGKERLFCFDFLDRGKYLEKHAARRLQTYSEQPAYSCSIVDFAEVVPC